MQNIVVALPWFPQAMNLINDIIINVIMEHE